MMFLYAIAAAALMFVAYLAHDFYNEQIRTRVIPVGSDRKSADHKEDRHLAR